MLVLDSWLETSILDENNRMEKVCAKGFEFPPQGLKFPTGHIKIQENIQPSRIYEFLLLKIAGNKCFEQKLENRIVCPISPL